MDMSGVPVAPALTVANRATTLPAATPGSDIRPDQRAEPVDPTQLPAPIKGLGIAPLDLFQVGDNDDVPLPPNPPRDPIAMVTPLDFTDDQPVTEVEVEGPAQDAPAPDLDLPKEPAPELARAVQVLDDEPRAPSFDIRR
ncbi:hypothetical protein [Jannaschia sp. CCS1]|uniref:hypothetical protein n=1 Tax=Jannaschia sp. (strain CCS1) TaxID=290400 RepID=UPI000053DA39|nr:hypothetical protein [Jannaschia sp. CCS1]ABD55614.1 hypothetical protein Jann_2697 [Jannaschia sp. CCS1]